jgi:ankyrin repeat protein
VTLQASRWFTRGWTLQELLAPKCVEFFSTEGHLLGSKSSRVEEIARITGISTGALIGRAMSHFSVEERMAWASRRETTREEDIVYSLFGVFDVHMPLIYGEGKEKALKRLQKEIRESSGDVVATLAPHAKANSTARDARLSKIHHWLSAPDPSINEPVSQDAPGPTEELSSPNKTVEEEKLDKDDILGPGKSITISLNAGPKQADSALHRAAWHGRYSAMEARLRYGENPDVEDEDGERPLQRAAWGGHTACAELLLKNGATLDHSKGLYGSALEIASCRGHIEFVRLLLERKAKNKEAALHQAAREGHEGIVNLLIQAGADVRHREEGSGYTLLHSAASSGNARVLKQILEAGGSEDIVEQEDTENETPLHCAASAGDVESFRLLLEYGADPFAAGGYLSGSVIHAASLAGHVEIIRLLLDEGVDCNDHGGFYATPLQAVCAAGKTDAVKVLLEHHADANIVGGHYGTALVAAIENDQFEIARQLVEHGADVNAEAKRYGAPITTLQLASGKGCVDLVRAILDKGTDPNHSCRPISGNALHSAIQGRREKVEETSYHPRTKERESTTERVRTAWHDGHLETVKLLIVRGTNLEREGDYGMRSPLMLAVHEYCEDDYYRSSTAFRRVGEDKLEDIIKLLLVKGANVNTIDSSGSSPLCKAAQSHFSIVQLLIDRGANVNQQDCHGRTPLWWAAYSGCSGIVSHLLKSGADPSITDKDGKTARRVALEPNKRIPYKSYSSNEIARQLLEHEQQNKRSTRSLSEVQPAFSLGHSPSLLSGNVERMK